MGRTATAAIDYTPMHIAFVLIEPKRAANVGAAARALTTMGFSDLRVVGEPLQQQPEARALAHGSHALLDAITSYPTLAAAIAGIDLVVGTSAKERHHRRYHYTPAQLNQLLQQKKQSVASAAILFGREESGLDKDAIARCDVVSQIPLASPYPSLNLAQAVMVYSYALSALALEQATRAADPGQFSSLKTRIGALLDQVGIAEQEKTRRWAMERLAAAQDEDVRFLHFICDKISRQIEN